MAGPALGGFLIAFSDFSSVYALGAALELVFVLLRLAASRAFDWRLRDVWDGIGTIAVAVAVARAVPGLRSLPRCTRSSRKRVTRRGGPQRIRFR